MTSDSLTAPTEPWMTLRLHLVGGEPLQRLGQRLHRALHVGLEHEAQLLDLARLDLLVQLLQRDAGGALALEPVAVARARSAICRALRSSATTSRVSPACGHAGEARGSRPDPRARPAASSCRGR